jgi:hypothetical protein
VTAKAVDAVVKPSAASEAKATSGRRRGCMLPA